LVFNPGEEPVEGYTNFLWTVIIAAGMELGISPEWLGPALGLLSTVLAALLTALIVGAGLVVFLGRLPVWDETCSKRPGDGGCADVPGLRGRA
jgi:hypothetical protein